MKNQNKRQAKILYAIMLAITTLAIFFDVKRCTKIVKEIRKLDEES